MRWTACLKGAGLVLAGVVGIAPAQMPSSVTSSVPRSSGGTYYTPYAAPSGNCPTPTLPPGTMVLPPGATVPPATAPGAPGAAQAPGMPPAAPAAAAAGADAAAGAGGERGSDALASAAPTMFGDLSASQICGPLTATQGSQTSLLTRGQPIPSQFLRIGTTFNFDIFQGPNLLLKAGQPITSSNLSQVSTIASTPLPQNQCGIGALNLAVRGSFLITENESPRPQTRAFATYNYFNNVDFGGKSADVHREMIGAEYAFMEGNASVGFRLPYVQFDGAGNDHVDLGDLTLIGKFAFYNDCQTGNVLSGGLVVTLPTGGSFLPAGLPNIHDVVLQPWAGGILNMEDLYVVGFSSIVVPVDSRDVTFLSEDLGVGYRVYSSDDGMITSIAPQLEAHFIVPLNHRGSDEFPTGLQDIFSLTFAARIGFGNCSLGIGFNVPLTGPKPYDYEGLAAFNYRF
jgi:hypothetical protein